jgi:biofilm PGA synthesis N-glycosyltransferase PgaC
MTVSHDNTGQIINEYAIQFPWIVALHRPDRGRRLAGAGVMEAFHFGYERLKCEDWEFIGKLDGDVVLEAGYFEHASSALRKTRNSASAAV